MQKDTIIYIGAPDITTRSRAHAGSGIRMALGALVIASVLVSGIAQALNVSPISSYRSSGLPHISALPEPEAGDGSDIGMQGAVWDGTEDEPEVPAGDRPIITCDLSRGSGGAVIVDNGTSYEVSTDEYAALASLGLGDDTEHEVTLREDGDETLYISDGKEPQAIIYHTHGTECYSETGISCSDADMRFRTTDTERNMIAVGRSAALELARRGISTVHCTIMHDRESYTESYHNSYNTLVRLTEKYPSVRCTIDMHRDAVMYGDGSVARPITETELGTAAQLMLVIGTDEMGAAHPNWRANFAVGAAISAILGGSYPALMRPISLRGAAYNQSFTRASLLVEVGSCGNTVGDAKTSAVLFARALAVLLKTQ